MAWGITNGEKSRCKVVYMLWSQFYNEKIILAENDGMEICRYVKN